MNPEIGRYLEGRLLPTINLIKSVYDYAVGQGPDVVASVQGRELCFFRGEPSGAGFLRVLPAELWLTLAFPRGEEIPDPLKRLKGPRGARKQALVRDSTELDYYMRRVIDAAYAQEG